MLRSATILAGVAVMAILAGCGGSGDGEDVNDTSATPVEGLPTSIPLGTDPVGLDGEVIIYRNTLEADAVASTLDHTRTFTLGYDASVDSVIAINCAKDGSRAVYLLENGVTLESRVVIADATGRREVPIPGDVMGTSLSPDGERVAVTSYLPDNARGVISMIDVANEEITPVYDRAGTIGPPTWSPDGTRIAFHALTDLDNQLFVYSLADGVADQVTNTTKGAFSPDWSPDGSLLAFSSVTETGNPQIFTAPASGGDPTQLTSTQAFKAEPRWSEDGSRIAYVGTIPVPLASVRPVRLHNVAVFTSASDGTDEVPFTDLALDAWLLGWCTAGPWLGQGWTER